MKLNAMFLIKRASLMIAGATVITLSAGVGAHAADKQANGYVYSPEVSQVNGGWNWLENGQPYTGFRYYMGTYYWFVNGVRQNTGWREAWGMTYYTDQDGRAVQGTHVIDGKVYNFGDDGTYYSRPVQGYVWDGSAANGGYRWYEDGQVFTGFRYYMGTYYWFVNGVRQNEGWRQAWGMYYYTDQNGRAVQGRVPMNGTTYDFGNDGTYYLRLPGTKTPTTPGFGGAPDADRSPATIKAPVVQQPEQAATTNTNQTTLARTFTGWVKNEKGTVIWKSSDFSSMKEAETAATQYMNNHMWDQGDMEPYSYGAY
ncbi:hypothetical protein [Fructobacillus tropaeoli]|uniref:hypothetical protein n=1 Tax=Fructobacillus tropaeoli TaxID=709323 RepID=UPI001A2C33CF|nr:hypothetical protein [Fructobacillus tropaeoli]GIC69797.1 hypothetical protein FT12353_04350 [Fructobacillus tropaeoli]